MNRVHSEFRIGQRAVVVVDAKPYDQGRITKVQDEDDEEDSGPITRLTIKSELLEGKEITFERFWSNGYSVWRRLFQDPLSNPGVLCYSQRETTYLIEGFP